MVDVVNASGASDTAGCRLKAAVIGRCFTGKHGRTIACLNDRGERILVAKTTQPRLHAAAAKNPAYTQHDETDFIAYRSRR